MRNSAVLDGFGEFEILVGTAVPLKYDRIGIEWSVIVKRQTLAQLEGPGQLVRGDIPRFRQPGSDLRPLPGGYVLVRKRRVHLAPHEAATLAPLRHRSVRYWKIAGRHGDAQCASLTAFAAARRAGASGRNRL